MAGGSVDSIMVQPNMRNNTINFTLQNSPKLPILNRKVSNNHYMPKKGLFLNQGVRGDLGINLGKVNTYGGKNPFNINTERLNKVGGGITPDVRGITLGNHPGRNHLNTNKKNTHNLQDVKIHKQSTVEHDLKQRPDSIISDSPMKFNNKYESV